MSPVINQLYQLMSVEKLAKASTKQKTERKQMAVHMELPQLIQFNANYPGQAEIRTANILTKSTHVRHI